MQYASLKILHSVNKATVVYDPLFTSSFATADTRNPTTTGFPAVAGSIISAEDIDEQNVFFCDPRETLPHIKLIWESEKQLGKH